MSRPEGTSWWTYWYVPRPGHVYSLRARSLRSGRVARRGYIGQTRRSVSLRVSEHQRGSREYHKPPQPWAECIVGHEIMWSSRRCYQVRLNWEEAWRIIAYFPIYNVMFNRCRPNPRRIAPFQIKGKGKDVHYAPHTPAQPGRARPAGRVAARTARVATGRTTPRRQAVGARRQGDPGRLAGRR